MSKPDYQKIFEQAYRLMDQPVVEGNCGELCGYHCCRNEGDELGIYLLPFEYETMVANSRHQGRLRITRHSGKEYDLPPGIKFLYFVYCRDGNGCLREMRPIQCRTYPFEPFLLDGELSLVVLKDQIHQCPLLKMRSAWRTDFLNGIFEGWRILLEIPQIRKLVEWDSASIGPEGVACSYHPDGGWQEGLGGSASPRG